MYTWYLDDDIQQLMGDAGNCLQRHPLIVEYQSVYSAF